MHTPLNAQEMQLHKVFSDDILFTIPSVQRPYSWTTEQAGELLDDLLEFIEHHGITEKNIEQIPEPYFLGSIVLVKGEKPEAEVLDGQQRLTTLTILLSALPVIYQKNMRMKLTNLLFSAVAEFVKLKIHIVFVYVRKTMTFLKNTFKSAMELQN
ncbi:DUF262 domain-containing protein [Bacillus alveayuensis]|uniref:DUF262 domain-containing protein n=1 Tax=Aeribacillus alveayuensis TaxID=279215 RepID=UPI000AFAB98D|nr:DUF262 domain-containing protein [Bacillus alveayuensis]